MTETTSTNLRPATNEQELTKTQKSNMPLWKKPLKDQIESPFVQVLVLILVYFDILLGATQSAADAHAATSLHFGQLRTWILYAHTVELVVQMIVFPMSYFGHWGFGVDTLLVAARLLSRHTIWMTATSPMLGFLRVWRILRLVQTYITIETKEHIVTKRELTRQLASVKKKATELESDLEQERANRKQNEDLTKQCRDEIETLREALRIAAEHVALALQGDFDNVMLDPPGEEEMKGLAARSISPFEALEETPLES